jgi:gamma-glutamylcyclotransferase (GGCT)/AIG2-like uncharacterized protein YtfP
LLQVFVYGTLKPGERFHNHYCAQALVNSRPAWVQGLLYHLPAENYPALTQGVGWVKGYLLTFAEPAILRLLDGLEDYQPERLAQDNEYQREVKDIFDEPFEQVSTSRLLAQAWVYWMEKTAIERRRGIYLPTGDWSESLFQ